MAEDALVDTDILLKVVSYRLAQASFAQIGARGLSPRVLGAARFMLATHVARARRIADPAAAAAELAAIEPLLNAIEPTAEETTLAADIEALAQSLGVPVDGGESQLLAILMSRSSSLMISGDKRAVAAIASMLTPLPPNRVACLEQLLGCLVEALGGRAVRAAICSEPRVDKSLTSAAGCSSQTADIEAGLGSYVESLRREAPALLCPGSTLPGSHSL